jgi:transposase
MSNTDFTLNLLDIKDENIKVLDVYEESIGNIRTKIIKARLSYAPGRCPDCGKYELVKNGFSKEISVKLVSLNGIPYRMQLKKQRFKCKNCHSTPLAHSPALAFNSSFSKAVTLRIIELSKDCLTLKEIAKLLGISISSVYRILYRNCHYRKHKHHLPTNLSFDEFLLKKDHYAFIGIDADTHRLLALLPGRTNHTVSQYFINHYSLQQRQQVQTVTIDMNANYASFILWLFPNAEIIIDRFRVIQLVQPSDRDLQNRHQHQLT